MLQLAQVCIICSRKNDNSISQQLRRIEELVRNQNEGSKVNARKLANSLKMSTHNNCPYGLYCSALRSLEMKANNKVEDIVPKMAGFIENADRGQLGELLRLMQGYFPSAYHTCERIWREIHN